ncbi:MAG: DUF4911 domain-containing protein [Syntrophaceae bacterium]|nr:DUF4911 domain-containing protein [Syntrophaceae bacterium]
MIEKYFKINRKDISYIKFVLEGYEGLAMVTTIDRYDAIVKLVIAPDFVSEVENIVMALKDEIDIEEIEGEEKS